MGPGGLLYIRIVQLIQYIVYVAVPHGSWTVTVDSEGQ